MSYQTGFVGPFTGADYGYGKTPLAYPLAISGEEQSTADKAKKFVDENKFYLVGGGLIAAGVIGLLMTRR